MTEKIRSMEEVIEDCIPIVVESDIDELAKALKDNGFIHKDDVVRLDEEEVKKIIEENMVIRSHHHRPHEGYSTIIPEDISEIICKHFAKPEIKLPEKIDIENKHYPYQNAEGDIAQDSGGNDMIDLIKKMNGLEE